MRIRERTKCTDMRIREITKCTDMRIRERTKCTDMRIREGTTDVLTLGIKKGWTTTYDRVRYQIITNVQNSETRLKEIWTESITYVHKQLKACYGWICIPLKITEQQQQKQEQSTLHLPFDIPHGGGVLITSRKSSGYLLAGGYVRDTWPLHVHDKPASITNRPPKRNFIFGQFSIQLIYYITTPLVFCSHVSVLFYI